MPSQPWPDPYMSISTRPRVVAAVVEIDGKLLVCKRPTNKRHGGLWEFPGGKVEHGESDVDAVQRELAEELGVDVISAGQPEFSVSDPGSPFVIHFLPVRIAGDPQCLEHSDLAWVQERDLLHRPLAPSDDAYVRFRLRSAQSKEPTR